MSMKKIARNQDRDDVLALFGPLAHRLSSEHWEVYADQGQYQRLLRGEKEGSNIATYSLLKPSIFDGFKQVVVASACMQETMFFHLFSAQGVELQPVKGGRLVRDLRYAQHEHGERITIHYACEEAWSKRQRDKLVQDDGNGPALKLLDRVREATLALFGTEPFIWMGNRDVKNDDFFGPTGERLPNTPHGLNSYQQFHNVVVISALNPPPQHFHFMESYSISGDEVRTAHYRTAVYQAVMRCSIRNPEDQTPKRVVVMDRDTAEWLAALFPGAMVEVLPGMGVVPRKAKAGRPRQHGNAADRTRAYRENQKRKWLAELDLINGTSLVAGRYPWFDQEVRSGMREFACDVFPLLDRDSVTQPPPSSTSGTAFATIYDAAPLAHVDHTDDESFIAFLRGLHGRVVAKEDAGLISPAHFDPDKATETSRGLDNITHVRGIWMDNDGGDLTPDAFADLFPWLRVVTWNTASSTPENPRWRVFIPTTCAMSIEVHRVIMAQIERVLNRAGYWSKSQLAKGKGIKDPRRHGFDESKFNAASLFYLPCQARHPEGSFFHDYGETDPKRGPLDLHQWIDECILSIRPEPEPEPVMTVQAIAPKPVLFPEMEQAADLGMKVGSKLDVIRQRLLDEQARTGAGQREEKIAKAIETWRSTPPGTGHQGFFRLGATLRGAGLDDFEIKAKLHEEAAYARSPKKRRAEIAGIIKSLRQRGTLPRDRR